MTFEWIRTIIILPMNVLVFIPAVVLYCTGYRWSLNHPALLVFGGILLLLGLLLAGWTMRLFAVKGKGTAAPWNPPKKLVVSGPYCFVRNPMITSVLTMTIAEALLLNAWQCWILFALFWIGNMIYLGSATTYCTPSISNSKRSHTAKFYYPINQAINIFSHSKHRLAVNFRQQYFVALPIYFPFFEERDLEKRFGESYLEYKRHVPRWIPRFTPWQPDEESEPQS